MKAVVQAEVTKLLTYPGICQAAAVSFALNLALSAASRFGSNIGVATGHGITPIGDIGVLQLAPAYVFMLMGAFAAGSEYQGGQLRITRAATPNRTRLFAAKIIALLAVVIPAAVIATLPLRRLRLIGVYLAFSVIAFGLTFLLKRAVTTFVGLVVLALIAWTGVANLPEVTQFLPHDAALSALGIGQSAATTLPPPTAALILAVWSLAAVGAAAAVLLRCDTK